MNDEKKRLKETSDDEYAYLGSSCSATDCTGLIPMGVTDTEELKFYEELYPYRPPVLDGK